MVLSPPATVNSLDRAGSQAQFHSVSFQSPGKRSRNGCSAFLRDFGYDTEMLGWDEVDETQLVALKGVVKVSHIVFQRRFPAPT
ncbi:MAG: hypothetical protein WBW85_14960 [Terriglobales bacterium]